jgi:hypothetical protein
MIRQEQKCPKIEVFVDNMNTELGVNDMPNDTNIAFATGLTLDVSLAIILAEKVILNSFYLIPYS